LSGGSTPSDEEASEATRRKPRMAIPMAMATMKAYIGLTLPLETAAGKLTIMLDIDKILR